LISVDREEIEFVFKPKMEKPLDRVSYYFLSEMFAQQFKKNNIKAMDVPAESHTHLLATHSNSQPKPANKCA
jgi:hypothetical protein